MVLVIPSNNLRGYFELFPLMQVGLPILIYFFYQNMPSINSWAAIYV